MLEHGSLAPNGEIQLFLLVGILLQSNGALLDFMCSIPTIVMP